MNLASDFSVPEIFLREYRNTVWKLSEKRSAWRFSLPFSRSRSKNNYEEMKEQYEVTHIVPLANMLHRYHLSNHEAISWMIENYREMEQADIKKIGDSCSSIFFQLVFPMITLFLGTMIDDLPPDSVADVARYVMIFLCFLTGGKLILDVLTRMISVFFMRKRESLKTLIQDLEYITVKKNDLIC